ncbi:MAG: EamA family transporter [Ruminococcaceae bacterium]|nr:EamA family transporter [Oscillospiraceae bacterium]
MKIKSVICIVASALLWGTMGIFVNTLSQFGLSNFDIVFYRVFFTSLILLVYMLIKDKAMLKIRFKDIWIFIGMGVFSFFFFNLCYFYTIKNISMSVAAALLYTAPVFVMIFSALIFKEKLSLFKIISIAVTVCGCFAVTGIFSQNHSVIWYNIVVGILSGLGYGLYSIFGRFGVKKYGTVTVTFYTFLCALLACIPFIRFNNIISQMSDIKLLSICVAAGVLTCALPYILYTYGLRSIPSGQASVIATVEPAFACVLGVLFFNDKLDFFICLGIVLILSAVIICSLDKD